MHDIWCALYVKEFKVNHLQLDHITCMPVNYCPSSLIKQSIISRRPYNYIMIYYTDIASTCINMSISTPRALRKCRCRRTIETLIKTTPDVIPHLEQNCLFNYGVTLYSS